MKRLLASVVVVCVTMITPASHASSTVYHWTVDGPPFGPNVSAAADGSSVELSGGGIFSGGSVLGAGEFRLFDAAGNQTAAGAWGAFEGATLVDESSAMFDPAGLVRNGVMSMQIDLTGLGEARLTVQCHDNPVGPEGFSLTIGGKTYGTFVVGSTTIIGTPA